MNRFAPAAGLLPLSLALLLACRQGPSGAWLYSGPECPDGYSNCSGPRTEEPKLLLLAVGEPRGPGIGFQCEHDGIALRFYSGAGTSLEGTGVTTIQVMVGQASQSATAADTRGTVATFREPRASLLESILLDADRTGTEAKVVVTGSGNQRHPARFDLKGMEENMKRLSCSL